MRRWKKPDHRAWFGRTMQTTVDMIEENLEAKIPLLELPRTTVRRLRER